jgi:hypothetical protein
MKCSWKLVEDTSLVGHLETHTLCEQEVPGAMLWFVDEICGLSQT